MHLLLSLAFLACVPSTPANADRTGSPTDVDPTSDNGGGTGNDSGGDPATGLTPESFASGVAEAVCGHMLECYGAEALAASGYADVDACVADTVGDLTDWASCPGFDPMVAGDCLEVYAESTCAQLENPNTFAVCDHLCG